MLRFFVIISFCFISLRLTAPGQEVRLDSAALLTPEPSALEKVAWLAGASVAFAGFDYVGYNLVRNTTTPKLIYRVVQLGVQAGLSWLLYRKFGLPTAIGFNIFWWTFGDDFIFYGITELCNVGGEWRGRGVYNNDISSNHTTWAYWTPVGLLRGMNQSKPIAGNTLVAQSLVGACVAVAITISF